MSEAAAHDATTPSAPGTVLRLPLTDQVAAAIRDMIVQDQLEPGQRVRERELSERLRVSRTPLREALKILAVEGLVELLPNRGAVVANPGQDEIHDRLELLGVLESLGGELAATRASDTEIAEVRALHFEMLAAFSRQDRLSYFKLNQRIHRAIILSSRNKALIEEHARLNAQVYRIRYRSNLHNRKWSSAIEEHTEILQALEARDGARLAKLLRDHLGSTWRKVHQDETAPPG